VLSNARLGASSVFLLTVCFSLHNIEEVVSDLPSWMAHQFGSAAPIAPAIFRVAIVAVTASAWVLYFAFRRFTPSPAVVWAVGVLSAALLANCVSHLLLTVGYQSLMPGTITAVVALGPASVFAFAGFCRRMRINSIGVLGLLVTGAALQLLVPVLIFGGS